MLILRHFAQDLSLRDIVRQRRERQLAPPSTQSHTRFDSPLSDVIHTNKQRN
jgi:hypothetical protein